MKTLVLVHALALVLAGGAYGRAWLDASRSKHPAVEAFETFYWKLVRHDLEAASALVLPGSEADLALTAAGAAGSEAERGTARGFALDVQREDAPEHAGQPSVHLYGQATVSIDPAGHLSAFGVPELHEVDARLVEAAQGWRVAAFRDTRLSGDGSDAASP